MTASSVRLHCWLFTGSIRSYKATRVNATSPTQSEVENNEFRIQPRTVVSGPPSISGSRC